MAEGLTPRAHKHTHEENEVTPEQENEGLEEVGEVFQELNTETVGQEWGERVLVTSPAGVWEKSDTSRERGE